MIQNQPPPLVSTSTPHGVEIKIPGVGVTPVAISTTLPAAVVQLSQQGRFNIYIFLSFFLCFITINLFYPLHFCFEFFLLLFKSINKITNTKND